MEGRAVSGHAWIIQTFRNPRLATNNKHPMLMWHFGSIDGKSECKYVYCSPSDVICRYFMKVILNVIGLKYTRLYCSFSLNNWFLQSLLVMQVDWIQIECLSTSIINWDIRKCRSFQMCITNRVDNWRKGCIKSYSIIL